MLIGQYKSKLTDKNRLSVPKKIRGELGDEMVIAKWYEDSLVLVSRKNLQELLTRLTGKQGLITSRIRDIDRFILGSAFEIFLDNQGRFVLPASLCEYAGITNDVVFVGLGDRAEVWSQVKWSEIEAGAQEKASKAIEKIVGGNKDD